MRETPQDLARLQALLDRSYDAGGAHLREVITPQRRLTAESVVERLQGLCLLVLATTTQDGRPITGSVDGIFFRGDFYFGSSPDSIRFRHIRRGSRVSVTYLPSMSLSVSAHGRAETIDIDAPGQAEFRSTLVEVCLPLYGQEWERMLESGVAYARVAAERMFTFYMEPGSIE